eukprot:scaffold11881_cov52-Phaeocystis_antarctica.AAC.7
MLSKRRLSDGILAAQVLGVLKKTAGVRWNHEGSSGNRTPWPNFLSTEREETDRHHRPSSASGHLSQTCARAARRV